MDNGLTLIKEQFALHNRLFHNVTEGLDEDGSTRPSEVTNHLAWLAGHVVSSRYALGQLIGIQEPEPHPSLFENGKGIVQDAEYPTLTECCKDWDAITARLMEALDTVSQETLNADGPFQAPMGKRIDQLVAFFAEHEAYHIGQMGILRKFFGKEAMSYS